MKVHRRLALGSLLLATGGLAHAAEQTILGNLLLVRNESTSARRKVVGKGKEPGSTNTIVGNPVASGATLVVSATGTMPSSQTVALPQGTSGITGRPFWSGDAIKGFRYNDRKGENGPVQLAQIRKGKGGTFTVKAVLLGKLGPVLVTPPGPGTGGCVVLQLTGGDTYSVQFGPTSRIENKTNHLFKATKPSVEGSCMTTTTTSTTTTSTTSTTLYGSPSRAFVDRVMGLLD
jgi:hypothetical protein